jgi:hypothetical protein
MRCVLGAVDWEITIEISGCKAGTATLANESIRSLGLAVEPNDANRRKFDIVAARSVDRIGRSLQDLLTFFGEIQALGIDLYLHQ